MQSVFKIDAKKLEGKYLFSYAGVEDWDSVLSLFADSAIKKDGNVTVAEAQKFLGDAESLINDFISKNKKTADSFGMKVAQKDKVLSHEEAMSFFFAKGINLVREAVIQIPPDLASLIQEASPQQARRIVNESNVSKEIKTLFNTGFSCLEIGNYLKSKLPKLI